MSKSEFEELCTLSIPICIFGAGGLLLIISMITYPLMYTLPKQLSLLENVTAYVLEMLAVGIPILVRILILAKARKSMASADE